MAVVWTGGKCFGLGVLAALGWLAVNFLDLLRFGTDLPPFLLLPFWARLAVRIVLVLALPTLILLLDRQARAWLGLHPAFALVGLSAVLVAALPALFALAAPQEVFALPLLVPTMCLGMALGLTDGMRHLRRPVAGTSSFSPGVFIGIGFGLVVLLAGIALAIAIDKTATCGPTNTSRSLVVCGILIKETIYATYGLTFACLLTAVIGGQLGYALGRRLPRLAKHSPAIEQDAIP